MAYTSHSGSTIGQAGEDAALLYLENAGFRFITRNYRKTFGEIDIIASKNDVIRFIEVKTSMYYDDTAFLPEIRVNARKIRNLKKICEAYLTDSRSSGDQQWQIDIISVMLNNDLTVHGINHLENAVFEKRY